MIVVVAMLAIIATALSYRLGARSAYRNAALSTWPAGSRRKIERARRRNRADLRSALARR